MKESKLFQFLRKIIVDIFIISYKEFKHVFTDAGVIIFMIALPLGYPMLYAYIYNNELVHEVPMVVVDQSSTSMSREFSRKIDGSSEVNVVSYCAEMGEAKELLKNHKAYGILLIPKDFSKKVARGEQSTVSLYSDMSSMLFYKAMLITITEVSLDMGREIQLENLGWLTKEQGRIATAPVEYESFALYNPQSGFASFLLPAILILLLQQTLLLGVGMLIGTKKSRHDRSYFLTYGNRQYIGSLRNVVGKATCYLLIYIVMTTWVLRVVPVIFKYPMLAQPDDLMLFLLPYLLSAIFFAITISAMVRDRETPMILFVFTSVPLVFLSGVSWPLAAIPEGWKWFSYLFPSTFGIQGFIKMNTMGADFWQVSREYHALWLQTAIYFGTACLSFHYLIKKHK